MSGPEGTPNGVDRLARIEASWDKEHSYGWVMIREEDARALVEIAKAAREYLEHTEDQDFRRGHTNTACPPLTRAMCKQYGHLRSALAGLDSEAK